MAELRLGLIGCGMLGLEHARCVRRIGGARFVAFADAVQAAADAAKAEFGGDCATTDPAAVLADPTIEAIYICTRNDSHADLAIAASEAGKHVFCEKPLALTLAGCQAVSDAVHRAGVIFMPGFKMRFYPLVQRARAFIPNPQVIVAQMMDDRWPDDHWAQDPVQGGANVHSQGVHMTDLLRHLAGGEPTQLWAAGGAISHPGHPCIDQCVATIRFDTGTIGSWVQGDAAMGHLTGKIWLQLFGGGRSVQLHERLCHATFWDGQRTWAEQSDGEQGLEAENRSFIEALRTGIQPALSVRDAVQATRIVLAAEAAIRGGAVQQL